MQYYLISRQEYLQGNYAEAIAWLSFKDKLNPKTSH